MLDYILSKLLISVNPSLYERLTSKGVTSLPLKARIKYALYKFRLRITKKRKKPHYGPYYGLDTLHHKWINYLVQPRSSIDWLFEKRSAKLPFNNELFQKKDN